jgi:GNAT superfamily N-acetyltransferase
MPQIALRKEDCQSYLDEYIKQGILEQGVYLDSPDDMYAVYDGSTVVGICGLVTDSGEWELTSLAVGKPYQRQGYGTAIVERLVEMTRESNPASLLYYGISFADVLSLINFYAKFNPIYTGMERGAWGGAAEFCIDCRTDKSRPNRHLVKYLMEYLNDGLEFDCTDELKATAAIVGQHQGLTANAYLNESSGCGILCNGSTLETDT